MRATLTFLFIIILLASCNSNSVNPHLTKFESFKYEFFKDFRNGLVYKIVKIGNQFWMAENLNSDKFLNGDSIPEAKTAEEWLIAANSSKPAWCYPYNDSKNGLIQGRLYNWFAVNDPRGLAPRGWHIPSLTEYRTLIKFLGGRNVAGGKMKNNDGFQLPSDRGKGGNGSNESGFTGIPVCSRYDRDNDDWGPAYFSRDTGISCDWWTSDVLQNSVGDYVFIAKTVHISSFDDKAYADYLGNNESGFTPFGIGKGTGLSVRCIIGYPAEWKGKEDIDFSKKKPN